MTLRRRTGSGPVVLVGVVWIIPSSLLDGIRRKCFDRHLLYYIRRWRNRALNQTLFVCDSCSGVPGLTVVAIIAMGGVDAALLGVARRDNLLERVALLQQTHGASLFKSAVGEVKMIVVSAKEVSCYMYYTGGFLHPTLLERGSARHVLPRVVSRPWGRRPARPLRPPDTHPTQSCPRPSAWACSGAASSAA